MKELSKFHLYGVSTVALVFLTATAWSGVLFLQFPFFVLGLGSVAVSARVSDWVAGSWWALTVWYIEVFNGMRVRFFGDRLPSNENSILICNHVAAVDWMFCWSLAIRKQCLGRIKNVLKAGLMMIPIFGWSFKMCNFLQLHRDWALDSATIQKQTQYFTENKPPMWLLLFPEGTRLNPDKLAVSQQFAAKNGFPVLQHVLTPRTRGWVSCFVGLRSYCKAVYDLTIVYDPLTIPRGDTFANILVGRFPKQCFIHIERFESDKLPKTEAELAQWCQDRFAHKDKSIQHFIETGSFVATNGSNAKEINEPKPALWRLWGSVIFYTLWSGFCLWLTWNYWQVRVYNVVAMLIMCVYTSISPLSGFFSSSKKTEKQKNK